jgi:hypothetical protein
MGKTDSFFIRGTVTSNGGNYAESDIDLGAYVDALGKSVLRIHNVSAQLHTGAAVNAPFVLPANSAANAAWQITTQSQSAVIGANDRSVISTGRFSLFNSSGAVGVTTGMDSDADILPQEWTNGYLVGVETIYLGLDASTDIDPCTLNVVMECTVETLSSASAMALALSQQ